MRFDLERSRSQEIYGDESGESTGLTDNQNRLLYLIDLHSKKANNRNDKDTWIRKQALSVIIYEGILVDVFDYDYAPQSTLIENRRVWCNLSQEGQSDIEFLREEGLINALLLSSKSYKAGVCYQISEKGVELIKYIPRREKEVVNEFAHKEASRELLKPYWDGETYWMRSSSGFQRKSTVTETEAVSYVSSAYIPQCLRYGGRPTMSNAHRAQSSGFGAIDTIRDQELDEIITLNSVSLIVAEYVPFGSNQVVQLNNTIGSTERVQGGFVSSQLDEKSCETTVEMNAELTSVDILDYTLTNHINFEAEIRFPEDPGIVQVETFGVSLNAEGTCFYGMQIEAVMDRIKDKISIDHLSRILVDVQQDSTKIVDSVISQRQRDLLDLMFYGDAANRNKINLIIANEINPHLTAEEYMDKGEFENELKQIIGDTKAAYDISEKDTLIFGAHGLLVCGPHARAHEPLLCAYMQFVTLDIFLQNFYTRMWILKEELDKTRSTVECIGIDPRALDKSRFRLSKLEQQLIGMEEILGYIMEALQIMEIPPEPQEQAGRSLYKRLEIHSMRSQLVRRATDVKKIVESTKKCLIVLEKKQDRSLESKIEHLYDGMQRNIKAVTDLQSSQDESANILRMALSVFVGTVSFYILDRVTGDWTLSNIKWVQKFLDYITQKNPSLWLFITVSMWTIVTHLVQTKVRKAAWNSKGIMEFEWISNEQIQSDKIRFLLEMKANVIEKRQYELDREIIIVSYDEPDRKIWGGSAPNITLEYDERNQFLLKIKVRRNIRNGVKEFLSSEDLKHKVLADLTHQMVFKSNREEQGKAI